MRSFAMFSVLVLGLLLGALAGRLVPTPAAAITESGAQDAFRLCEDSLRPRGGSPNANEEITRIQYTLHLMARAGLPTPDLQDALQWLLGNSLDSCVLRHLLGEPAAGDQEVLDEMPGPTGTPI